MLPLGYAFCYLGSGVSLLADHHVSFYPLPHSSAMMFCPTTKTPQTFISHRYGQELQFAIDLCFSKYGLKLNSIDMALGSQLEIQFESHLSYSESEPAF